MVHFGRNSNSSKIPLHVLVTCKCKKGSDQCQPRKRGYINFKRSKAANAVVSGEIWPKFDTASDKIGCDRPVGLGDIHVLKCLRTDAPAQVPSYKLTL